MKKKLVSLLSLILAVVMVMPVSVFADGEETEAPQPLAIVVADNASFNTSKNTFYFDEEKTTLQLNATGGAGNYIWTLGTTASADIASISQSGVVTPKAAGKATFEVDSNGAKKSITITFAARECKRIIVESDPTVMDYYTGDTFSTAGMIVKAVYNLDADTKTLSASDYTVSPADGTPLNTTHSGKTASITYKTFTTTTSKNITVAERLTESIRVIDPPTTFEVGDVISGLTVEVTYNNGTKQNITSGFTVSPSGELTASDTSYTVTYQGKSFTVNPITVKPEETEPEETDPPATQQPTTLVPYVVVYRAADKMTYEVGETFNPAGMIIKLYDYERAGEITSYTYTANTTLSGLTAFTTAGTKTVRISHKFTVNGKNVTIPFDVTDITVTAKQTDSRKLNAVTSAELEESVYSVGDEITKEDIKELKVKLYKETGTSKTATETETLTYEELADFDFFTDIEIEVLDKDGKQKSSSTSRDTIRESDVVEDSDGDKYVNVRISYPYYSDRDDSKASTKEYNFKVEVGTANVSYIYDDTLIAEYEELEDALEFCNDDDDEEVWGNFDLSKYILLKLGKDFKIDSSFDDFSPEHNIVIDLAGNDLTFYSDTIVIDEADKDYTVTIKNSSDTDAKFTYHDKDVTITLKKGESIKFEYDKPLPGFYTVEVSVGENGKVTASPALTDKKVVVGKGTDVTFTITPDKGYEINTVKAASKSVVSDTANYSVNSNTGVATYKLKNVSKDTKLEVTFKESKSDWKNPYSDVYERDEYYSAVEFVTENGLFQGNGGKFSPNNTMTRAMFVTVLGRLSGLTDATAKARYGTKSDFTDVSYSDASIAYAVPYIKWATENGLIEGYGDGRFGPQDYITHQQMYVLMYRYAVFVENLAPDIAGTTLTMFDRSSVADWAADAVKYAQKNDFLIYTTGSRIDPTGDAKRSELAQLLEVFCKNVMGWADKK